MRDLTSAACLLPTRMVVMGRTTFLLGATTLLMSLAACESVGDRAAPERERVLQLERTAVLQGGADGAFLRLGSQVARDSRGRYYAAQLTDAARIAVFDPGGRFQGTIGREGGGPGEFVAIQRVFVSPGDSLFVVDFAQRVSVLAPDHRFVRSFRPPGAVRSIAFPPGGQLLLSIFEPLSIPAVVLTDRDGNVVRGLVPGSDDLRDRPRLMATAGADGVWTGFRNRYRLELLHPAGRREKTVTRDLEWFGSEPPAAAGRRERGMMQEFAYDAESHSLRVLLFREDPEFRLRNAPRGGRGGEGRTIQLGAAEARERFDIFLEVLDTRSGRAIAAAEIGDHLIAGFLSPDELYAHRESEDGSVVVDVFRVRLLPGAGPGPQPSR